MNCKEYDNRTGMYQCTNCGHQWRANHAIESIIDYCQMCRLEDETDDTWCEPDEDYDSTYESRNKNETFAVDDFFSHCGVDL
jgi:hypothetical protein